MLFRYTENPPENRFFASGFLRLSGWRMGYTENSSFPYTCAQCEDLTATGPMLLESTTI